ncbi:MAG: hypothetical protein AB7V58_18690 [Solirubrobacterales bacterium]
MAGKRDDIFVLGEEQLGAEAPSAPVEEPTASAPLSGRSRAPQLRLAWPLVSGGLVLLAAVALLVRLGDDGEPAPPRAVVPTTTATPPIVHAPARSHTAPERELRRLRSRERRPPARPAVVQPAPVAESPAAPVVTYEPAPEPAPEVMTAPSEPAPPAPAPRPEFGIER